MSAKFGEGEAPPKGLLERWLKESHGVIGGAPDKKKATSKTKEKKRA